MEHVSTYAVLFFFGFLYKPVSTLIGIIEHAISRHCEYSADAFAAATSDPDAMSLALKKLTVDNLSNLTPHTMKVMLSYSHPPVLERIKAITKKADQNHDNASRV